MGIFNKKKQITVYALTHTQVKNKFLTISDNKYDMYEYVMALLQIQHQAHFETWCQVRALDKEDFDNWVTYYSSCISDEEKSSFQAIKIKYNLRDVIAIMRMFGNCFPIGCSFDTEAEYEYFSSIISENFSNISQKVTEKDKKADVDK